MSKRIEKLSEEVTEQQNKSLKPGKSWHDKEQRLAFANYIELPYASYALFEGEMKFVYNWGVTGAD